MSSKSWFAGLLGKIHTFGTERELMQGIDFRDGLTITPNAETKLLEVRSTATGGGGATIPAPALVATSNITQSGDQVVDGVHTNALAAGSIVLCTAQNTPAQNGPMVVNNAGSWARPPTYDSDADVVAALGQAGAAVLGGTLGAGTVWFQSSGTTIAGAKTWTKLSTPSLLQNARSGTLAAQILTQHKGVALLEDPANGRNVADHDRADIREYGANMGGVQRTTAAGTAASAAITLANAKNYQNGNWLMLSGLGAAHGMTTPAAPTLAVQGTTGASTVSVKVVALTSTGGYTPASAAATVATANAVLSETNFVEIFCADVASAYRYLIYVQFGGVGAYTLFGGVIAHMQYDADGAAYPCSFRLTSSTVPAAPAWLPSTAPATGRANGLRAQIKTGGGTTAITVFPLPVTSGAGVNCDVCNLIPLEDACNALGDAFSSEVRMPRGTAYATGQWQLRVPARFEGSNGGNAAAGSILLFRDGCGFAAYGPNGADQWQPGTHYRLGDRVVSQLRTGATGCWQLTAIAAGAGWGVSATTEPTWNYTVGGTTGDNGHTWTFISNTGIFSAAGAKISHIAIKAEGRLIPANRIVVPDDLRTSRRYLANGAPPQLWAPGITPALNSYYIPTATSDNGKSYKATAVAGATHATTEPVWPKVTGATVVDNGNVTWTCVDTVWRQGAGFLVCAPITVDTVQIKDFNGSGLVGDGNSYSSGSSINRAQFRIIEITGCTGHHVAVYGSDANGCVFESLALRPRTVGGSCSIQDQSFYGNAYKNAVHDGGARFQNTPWASSVQRLATLENCYTEGTPGSETDWSSPGIVITGLHGQGFRAESLPRLFAKGVTTGAQSSCFDVNPLEYDPSGTTYTRQLIGGFERKLLGTGTVAAGTLLQEQHMAAIARGRSQQTVRGGSVVVRETAHFDARGINDVFPRGIRTGSSFAGEGTLNTVTAIPTVGVFAAADRFPWGLDNRRQGIKPSTFGELGAAARANSAAYAAEAVVTASSKSFVAVCGGTSAGSPPAGLATASQGVYVTDGSVVWQCWQTSQDPLLVAIPNLSADPVTQADADATVTLVQGPVFELAAATANRTITLSTTGTMPGDVVRFENNNNVAFTWTFTSVDSGSVVLPAGVRCWVEFTMRRSGVWRMSGSGLFPSQNSSNVVDATTARTAKLSDADRCVDFSNGAAIAWTIPPASSVAFRPGTVLNACQLGAGAVTVTAGAGVTLRLPPGHTAVSAGQYATFGVRLTDTADTWVVLGNLT